MQSREPDGDIEVSVTPWYDIALRDKQAFAESLTHAGAPDELVAEALRVLDDTVPEVRSIDKQLDEVRGEMEGIAPFPRTQGRATIQRLQNDRITWVNRVAELLHLANITIEPIEEISLQIPLFVFAAADRSGCTASFLASETRSKSAQWSFAIAGSGFSGSADGKAFASSTFTARRGEVKQVFIPATVQLEKVTYQRRGHPAAAPFYQVDIAKTFRQGEHLGTKLLTSPPVLDDALPKEVFPLSGDATGEVSSHTFGYTTEKVLKIDIGVKTPQGVEAKLTGSKTLERTVQLAFDLSGGVDYNLFRILDPDCYGVAWGPDTP